jgi:phosphoribosyl-ATP pyrophosphohydrolase/phosphoribosyl-AMP cyclohydrolase
MVDTSFIKFDDKGLVPAIAEDSVTGEVLMLAYMNREALLKTIETKRAHYFSRSRGRLWQKGETSGNFQDVKEMRYDCDSDAILLLVEPRGPACHTGERSCFYRSIGEDRADGGGGPLVLKRVFDVIKARKGASPTESYVASLYSKGLKKMLEKIREESGELIEASEEKGDREVVYELTDLWFHTLVLLSEKGIDIDDVFREFKRRFGTSGIEEKLSRERSRG